MIPLNIMQKFRTSGKDLNTHEGISSNGVCSRLIHGLPLVSPILARKSTFLLVAPIDPEAMCAPPTHSPETIPPSKSTFNPYIPYKVHYHKPKFSEIYCQFC